MVEAFSDLMDSLYWEGYAEQLAEDNPQAYTFELENFLKAY